MTMNHILPGLSIADAKLSTQLMMLGLQKLQEDAQRAGLAIEAAIAAAQQPPATTEAAAPQKDAP